MRLLYDDAVEALPEIDAGTGDGVTLVLDVVPLPDKAEADAGVVVVPEIVVMIVAKVELVEDEFRDPEVAELLALLVRPRVGTVVL